MQTDETHACRQIGETHGRLHAERACTHWAMHTGAVEALLTGMEAADVGASDTRAGVKELGRVSPARTSDRKSGRLATVRECETFSV